MLAITSHYTISNVFIVKCNSCTRLYVFFEYEYNDMFSENDLHKFIEQQDYEHKNELRQIIQKRLKFIQEEKNKSTANETLKSENIQK